MIAASWDWSVIATIASLLMAAACFRYLWRADLLEREHRKQRALDFGRVRHATFDDEAGGADVLTTKGER